MIERVPNTHPVSDFLQWQRDGTLNLNPEFQRRSVWKPGAASYFIDTLVRGLPVPLIFLRSRVDLRTQRYFRDVVDGQQRLRAVLSFIDPTCIADLEPDQIFTVSKTHNSDIGGRTFGDLADEYQHRILNYHFSVQSLPPETEDRDILQIFARMNSTGVTLNGQELRNSHFFGAYKTLMYELAYEQLERWVTWKIFTKDQLSRMSEVELTSDLVLAMMEGISGKTKAKLDSVYEKWDSSFPASREISRRFRKIMDMIEERVGSDIAQSVFDREMHFYSLFAYFYDKLWGLGSPTLRRAASDKKLPRELSPRIHQLSNQFKTGDVPRDVLESVTGASTDIGKRRTRFIYTAKILDGKASSQSPR